MHKQRSKERKTFSGRFSALLVLFSVFSALFGIFAPGEIPKNETQSLLPFSGGALSVFGNRGKDETFAGKTLIPGGTPFGVKLYTKGVIVVGLSDVETEDGTKRVAENAGIKTGDVIKEIDGKKVGSVSEVSALIEGSGGKALELTLDREGEEVNVILTPERSVSGTYRAGLWIRDSTSGIGTVTYIDPDTLDFAGLGHGICDVDTALLMPLSHATVLKVRINGAVIGKAGDPGELKGTFEPVKIGSLSSNTPYGVFGRLDSLPEGHFSPMPVASEKEIETGKAEVICTVSGETLSYSARIVRKERSGSPEKNFVIEVTDKRLIDRTGGIVQGMSGSPVIQNGKIVGAVTHVMINDPKRGYGIYIENMLKNAA